MGLTFIKDYNERKHFRYEKYKQKNKRKGVAAVFYVPGCLLSLGHTNVATVLRPLRD